MLLAEKVDQYPLMLDPTPAEFLPPAAPKLAYSPFLVEKRKISLKSGMSSAKSQGQAGTCSSFAITASLEYIHNKLPLSEACLIHEAEREFGDCAGGLSIGAGITAAKKNGLVEEAHWQYDDSQLCWSIIPSSVHNAPRHKINHAETLFSRNIDLSGDPGKDELGEELGQAVMSIRSFVETRKCPAIIAVPVFKDPTTGWGSGSVIVPGSVLEVQFVEISSAPKKRGWHAISVCGFDDFSQVFEFKNSWGSWWGTQGYGTISYGYVSRYAREGMGVWL